MLCYNNAFILTLTILNETASSLSSVAIPPSLHSDVPLASVWNCGITSVFLSSSFNFALRFFFFLPCQSGRAFHCEVGTLCRRTDGQSKHKKDTKHSIKKARERVGIVCVCDVHPSAPASSQTDTQSPLWVCQCFLLLLLFFFNEN